MDLILLKTFMKVATMGSVTKASAGLFVTQSAVSRRLKQLESYFGRPLLEKTGSSLTLTEAGHLLMEKGRRILEIEQELVESLGGKEARQRLSFCCTPSLGYSPLTDVISRFVASHADVADVSCLFNMPEEALQGIDSGRFHLALLDHCDEVDFSGYITYPFPADEVLFISSADSGLPLQLSLKQLFGRRLYLKKEKGCAKRFLDKNLRRLGCSSSDFSGIIYYDDCPFIIGEVAAGRGLTFASSGLVDAALRNGTLLAHRVDGFDHRRPRTLVLSAHDSPPILQAFIDTLCTTFDLVPPADAA